MVETFQEYYNKNSPEQRVKLAKAGLVEEKTKSKQIRNKLSEARAKSLEVKSERQRLQNIREQQNIRKKHGSTFKKITKAFGYKPQLSKTLQSYAQAGNMGGSSTGSQGVRPVGRPRGSLKHVSPFTGQPIDAVEFYHQMRQFRRIQSQRADQIQEQQQRQFAQRGVPPNQIQNTVEQNMRRNFEMQRQQVQTQMPMNQYPNQNQSFNQGRGVFRANPNNGMMSQVRPNIPRYGQRTQFIEADIMGNPKVKIAGDSSSFFN